jgi:hypothetical protein
MASASIRGCVSQLMMADPREPQTAGTRPCCYRAMLPSPHGSCSTDIWHVQAILCRRDR